MPTLPPTHVKYVNLFHAPMPLDLGAFLFVCFCQFMGCWGKISEQWTAPLIGSPVHFPLPLSPLKPLPKKVNSSGLVANRLKECSCGNFQHLSITFLPLPLHLELDIAYSHRYQIFVYHYVYSTYTYKSILPHMHTCILYWLCFSNTFIICPDWISCPSKGWFKKKTKP